MNHPTFIIPSLETMGTLLPTFEFRSLIASDDFAAVYLANQRSLERDVAIKILSPHVSGEPAFQELFENTSRSMAKLNHPNLIRVFDSGCVTGMLYVVMEYVPGNPLARSIQAAGVDFRQASHLVQEVCAGLAHAHEHQIIHGDLNPSNILLNQKAEPKIGNFGISHPVGSGMIPTTNPQFIAPEILANPAHADHRSDIYAAGAILYELITGRPHAPDAPPPSAFSTCGPKLDAIWRQATDPNPDRRFPDAVSFGAALNESAPRSRAPITSAVPASKKLAVRPAAAASRRLAVAPTAHKRLTKAHSGFTGKLIRNLCIIAGLLFAISLAWENLKTKRIQQDKKNREILAQNAADREKAVEEARQRAQEERAKRAATDSALDSSRPKVAETPADSLERLRKALASGKRTEMPVGSVRKGENDYLLITEPMSWPDAAWFAEQHGGHLAIPNTEADLTWLVGSMAAGKGIWIGGARSGRNSWALADGSPWKPAKEPTGIGHYLSADKFGFLRAENASALHPFVIQWHRDGSNPGTLAALLNTTRNTLTQPNQAFPPGTRAHGTRHYLFVSRPVTWHEAVKFSETAGGNLAVPSDSAETINLEEIAKDSVVANGIWLGGFLKEDHWLWITGEPWKTAKWAEGSESTVPGSSLILRPGKGWDAQDPSQPASGFIIEWSGDPKPTIASQNKPSVPESETSALVTRAKELIQSADARRTEQLAANARRFSSELDTYLRGLSSGGQTDWAPHVEQLTNAVKDNRLPSSVPRSSGINLSEKMADLVQFHVRKQDQSDMEFMAAAEKIRIAFVAKLRDAQTQATQSGQPKLAQSIGETLNDAGNLENWVRSLGVELHPENPEPAAQTRTGSNQNRSNNAGSGDLLIE